MLCTRRFAHIQGCVYLRLAVLKHRISLETSEKSAYISAVRALMTTVAHEQEKHRIAEVARQEQVRV